MGTSSVGTTTVSANRRRAGRTVRRTPWISTTRSSSPGASVPASAGALVGAELWMGAVLRGEESTHSSNGRSVRPAGGRAVSLIEPNIEGNPCRHVDEDPVIQRTLRFPTPYGRETVFVS